MKETAMTTSADYNVITATRSGGPITERADTIYGTDYAAGGSPPAHSGADLIFGAGGGDTIYAKFGDDVINGGVGNVPPAERPPTASRCQSGGVNSHLKGGVRDGS